MNKRILKIGTIIFTVLFILFFECSVIFAAKTPDELHPKEENIGEIKTVGENVLSIIRGVGTAIALGILMILGIKYMMGSAEEKAEYKKTMIPYIIGAVLLVAGVNIATAIFRFANSL